MICVDASVAVKWLFSEQHSTQALALVRDTTAAGERIIAPALLPIEITNVIRQRMRRGALALDQARGELDHFFSFEVTTASGRVLNARALAIAAEQISFGRGAFGRKNVLKANPSSPPV